MFDYKPIIDSLKSDSTTLLKSSADPAFWALEELKVNLFDNQIEIVEAVTDLNIKEVAILQARGAGKTFSVGLGLVKVCLDKQGVQIGIFGPKADQAERIIKEICEHIIKPTSPIHSQIDWRETTNSKLKFMNGSEMLAISAAETTMQEGWHFNIVVLDECHRISDISANQRIIPMLGSLPIGKVIKLGISMYRNNFWKSCCAPGTSFKVLSRDWTKCPILLTTGSIMYHGEELPLYALKQMPLSMKQKMFPDRPDLHFDGALTEWDFKTQYGMEWLQDVSLLLNENASTALVDSKHDILLRSRPETQEIYFFGLDTASGTLFPGKDDLDFTALSIWRLNADHTKEKVAAYEWQGNVLDQMEEIKQIVHPLTGIFPCAFGICDYSNVGIPMVEQFQRDGLPIEGITFQRSEPISKKNFKNAMFDQFIFELEQGRIKFPSREKMKELTDNKDMRTMQTTLMKSFNEWLNIESRKGAGINSIIQAPSDLHDDHCCADVMAVWGMDKNTTFKAMGQKLIHLPTPVIGTSSMAGRGIPIPQEPSKKNRYLK